jgi:hypothetical protein
MLFHTTHILDTVRGSEFQCCVHSTKLWTRGKYRIHKVRLRVRHWEIQPGTSVSCVYVFVYLFSSTYACEYAYEGIVSVCKLHALMRCAFDEDKWLAPCLGSFVPESHRTEGKIIDRRACDKDGQLNSNRKARKDGIYVIIIYLTYFYITITILDIIHGLVFYLKHRVSETEFSPRL